MKEQIIKNIKELDEVIETLRTDWETASDNNLRHIDLISAALKDAITTRDSLQNLLDILNEG